MKYAWSLVPVMVASAAFGQSVDPAAKAVLDDTVNAIKELHSASFRATYKLDIPGMEAMKGSADLQVKFLKGATADKSSYRVEGVCDTNMVAAVKKDGAKDSKAPSNKVLGAFIEGASIEWLDESTKTLMIRPLPVTGQSDGPAQAQTPATLTFKDVLMSASPFKNESDSPTLTLEKSETINGEVCQVIKASIGANGARILYVGALDKLPRRWEQQMVNGSMKRIFEFRDWNTDSKLTLKDIHLAAPEGWKTDKVDAPPPPPPPAAAPKVGPKMDPVKRQADDELEQEKKKRESSDPEKIKEPAKPEDPKSPK